MDTEIFSIVESSLPSSEEMSWRILNRLDQISDNACSQVNMVIKLITD
jgi:hypothetical protein